MRRQPLLLEAIKGGMEASDHELHGDLEWFDGEKWHSAALTHDKRGRKATALSDTLKDHKQAISDPSKYSNLTFSVIKKNRRNPGSRFNDEGKHPTDKSTVAWLSVEHPNVVNRHPESGLPMVKVSQVYVHQDHRRKGWGSTIFDHAHRMLKKHAGLHLVHDWDNQSHAGERYAARQETARGKGFVPRHRRIQKGYPASRPAAMLDGPHRVLYPHHEKVSHLANKILDQAGGYYTRKHIQDLRRTAARLGVPKDLLTYVRARDILRLHGGEEQ